MTTTEELRDRFSDSRIYDIGTGLINHRGQVRPVSEILAGPCPKSPALPVVGRGYRLVPAESSESRRPPLDTLPLRLAYLLAMYHPEVSEEASEFIRAIMAQELATQADCQGVSLYDVAIVIDEDDRAAKVTVKRWIDSKKIHAEPIGKCPEDGRRLLYRLSEILSDVAIILGQTRKEQTRLRKALAARLRSPAQE